MRLTIILLISFLTFSCGTKEEKLQKETNTAIESTTITFEASQFELNNMTLRKLEQKEFYTSINTTGYIDVPPQNKASVTSFMAGYVKQTPLLVGDKVKKGDLVITLENPDFVELQQDYLEAAEKLNYLQAEFNRQKTLFEEKITSEKNYLKAESDYKSNLAHYNGLRQKLLMLNMKPALVEQGNITSSINLYAPIAGSVTKVNVSNGSYVNASKEIIEIVNTDHIHLELTIFEKDVLNVKKGQPIKFKISETSDQYFNAEVYLVGNSVDETTRTIKIHGHLEDESQETVFVRGMFVEATIFSDPRTKWAIAKDVISESDGAFFVYVLTSKNKEHYTFERQQLEIGQELEDYVEVLNFDTLENKQFLNQVPE